jgi:hypothetical protein
MTFDEWFKNEVSIYDKHTYTLETLMRKSWDAAQAAERETIANTIEEMSRLVKQHSNKDKT